MRTVPQVTITQSSVMATEKILPRSRISPYYNQDVVLLAVPTSQPLLAKETQTRIRIVPSASKNIDGTSFPSILVEIVNIPSGKAKLPQPIWNGNLLRLMLAGAMQSQTMAKPHIMSAINQPTTYNSVRPFQQLCQVYESLERSEKSLSPTA